MTKSSVDHHDRPDRLTRLSSSPPASLSVSPHLIPPAGPHSGTSALFLSHPSGNPDVMSSGPVYPSNNSPNSRQQQSALSPDDISPQRAKPILNRYADRNHSPSVTPLTRFFRQIIANRDLASRPRRSNFDAPFHRVPAPIAATQRSRRRRPHRPPAFGR